METAILINLENCFGAILAQTKLNDDEKVRAGEFK